MIVGTRNVTQNVKMLKLTTLKVLWFHSALQLNSALSRKQNDQPYRRAMAQNKPHDMHRAIFKMFDLYLSLLFPAFGFSKIKRLLYFCFEKKIACFKDSKLLTNCLKTRFVLPLN